MGAPGVRMFETLMLMGLVVGEGFSVMELTLDVVVVGARVGVMIGPMGTSSGPTLPTERVILVRLGVGVTCWKAVTVVTGWDSLLSAAETLAAISALRADDAKTELWDSRPERRSTKLSVWAL